MCSSDLQHAAGEPQHDGCHVCRRFGRAGERIQGLEARHRPGMALGAGAVAALVAVIIGVAVTGPTNVRLAKLRKSLASASPDPVAADPARVAALQARAECATIATALLLPRLRRCDGRRALPVSPAATRAAGPGRTPRGAGPRDDLTNGDVL